jgi:hypothetical protein
MTSIQILTATLIWFVLTILIGFNTLWVWMSCMVLIKHLM